MVAAATTRQRQVRSSSSYPVANSRPRQLGNMRPDWGGSPAGCSSAVGPGARMSSRASSEPGRATGLAVVKAAADWLPVSRLIVCSSLRGTAASCQSRRPPPRLAHHRTLTTGISNGINYGMRRSAAARQSLWPLNRDRDSSGARLGPHCVPTDTQFVPGVRPTGSSRRTLTHLR